MKVYTDEELAALVQGLFKDNKTSRCLFARPNGTVITQAEWDAKTNAERAGFKTFSNPEFFAPVEEAPVEEAPVEKGKSKKK